MKGKSPQINMCTDVFSKFFYHTRTIALDQPTGSSSDLITIFSIPKFQMDIHAHGPSYTDNSLTSKNLSKAPSSKDSFEFHVRKSGAILQLNIWYKVNVGGTRLNLLFSLHDFSVHVKSSIQIQDK